MFYLTLVLLSLLVLESIYFADCTVTVQLERFEQQTGFHMANFSGIRVRKFNRTTWVLDGAGDFFVDLTDEYQLSLTAAHSPLGNNQWNEYPMKISKDKACNILNGPYKEYQSYFIDNSNMPRVEEEWVCPFPKGHYWVRNLAPDGSWIPSVVASGYWRLTISIFDASDEIVLRFVSFLRVKKDYM
ncbi:uncharacterized protein LOC131695407 [Topomyia yanbarensis]|uniref:uncharacterized protein LOC131695407 n=1 Tax=Topomyia yanbarensis TaxID=2498891 RepID=UPI00273C7D13|nr:uncharacterized protein LOC131695407 [Topomyia yanbarensis]